MISSQSTVDADTYCQTISHDFSNREIDELADIATRAGADIGASGTDDLRAAAYFHWRKLRWNDGQDEASERGLHAIVNELQVRGAIG